MNSFNQYRSASNNVSTDLGLRSYMLGIYNYMSVALLVSGLTAFIIARTGLAKVILSSPLAIVVMFAPIVMTIYLSSRINRMSANQAIMNLIYYSILMGLSLSTIFITFNIQNIASAFFIASSMFLSASIYGYTTKKDLSPMGSMLFMILIGLLVASLVNMFVRSSGFEILMSFASVIIFALFTAYDTQSLRNIYYHNGAGAMSKDELTRISIMGAIRLYIDFINMFVSLLNLSRSRN